MFGGRFRIGSMGGASGRYEGAKAEGRAVLVRRRPSILVLQFLLVTKDRRSSTAAELGTPSLTTRNRWLSERGEDMIGRILLSSTVLAL